MVEVSRFIRSYCDLTELHFCSIMVVMDKGRGHELLYRYKIESLEKNKELLYGYIAGFGLEQSTSCDLIESGIGVVFCDNRVLVMGWKAFTHFVSGLPCRDSVGGN